MGGPHHEAPHRRRFRAGPIEPRHVLGSHREGDVWSEGDSAPAVFDRGLTREGGTPGEGYDEGGAVGREEELRNDTGVGVDIDRAGLGGHRLEPGTVAPESEAEKNTRADT